MPADNKEMHVGLTGTDISASKVVRELGDESERTGDRLDEMGRKAGDANDSLDGLGAGARKAGDGARKAEGDFGKLDSRILESRQEIERLARAIANSADEAERKNLFKALRKEQASLRNDMKVKDLLPNPAELLKGGRGAGSTMAVGMSAGLTESLRSLGPVAGAFAKGIGIQVAAVAGPFIAAAIGAAVVAGVGLGVVGLGASLAAQDDRVKAAARHLTETVKTEFTAAAEPMVEPLVDSLGQLETAGANLAPQWRNIFGSAAPTIEHLTDGLIGLAQNVMPGITDAVEAWGPVAADLAPEIAELGQDFSAFFTSLSEGSADGGQALGDFLDIVGGGLRVIGLGLEGGARMYGMFRDLITTDIEVPGWITDLATALFPLLPVFEQAKSGIEGMTQGSGDTVNRMRDLKSTTQQTGEATRAAAADMKKYADAVREQQRAILSSEDSHMALEEAIDRAAEAGKKNNDGMSAGTEKGRANRRMLLDLAAAAHRSSEDITAMGGSQADANAELERGRAKFLASAAAMKVPQREATELANRLFGIPKNTNPKVRIDATQAKTAAQQIQEKINNLKGRHIAITLDAVLGQSSISLGNMLHQADGGRVVGIGGPRDDRNVRAVSNGEYIVQAAAVADLGGFATFDAYINRGVLPPGGSAGSGGAGSAPAAAAAGRGSEESMYRAFARALRETPVLRLPDNGLAADLLRRGG